MTEPVCYTVFEKVSGRILRSGTTYDDPTIQVTNQEVEAVAILKSTDSEHYIRDGALVERPTLSIADTDIALDQEISFSVPAGTVVAIDGDEHVIEDGVIEFSSSKAGVVQMNVTPPFPWKPCIVRIVVA